MHVNISGKVRNLVMNKLFFKFQLLKEKGRITFAKQKWGTAHVRKNGSESLFHGCLTIIYNILYNEISKHSTQHRIDLSWYTFASCKFVI